MPHLFDAQPPACRSPLPPRNVKTRSRDAAIILRILAYDPAPAYARIAHTANPRKRIQVRTDINLQQLFPKKKDGLCDCGCSVPLAGRQTRWATPACAAFTWYVYAIIAGRRTEIRNCLKAWYGKKCSGCGLAQTRVQQGRGRLRSGIEYDHVVPVHRGGGACWLSNYVPLCIACHKEKTAADRLIKKAAAV